MLVSEVRRQRSGAGPARSRSSAGQARTMEPDIPEAAMGMAEARYVCLCGGNRQPSESRLSPTELCRRRQNEGCQSCAVRHGGRGRCGWLSRGWGLRFSHPLDSKIGHRRGCLGQVTRERPSPDRCHGNGRQKVSASMITPSTIVATELPSSRKRSARPQIRIYPSRCPATEHRALTADEVPRVVHATETVPSLGMRSKAGWLTHSAAVASLDNQTSVLLQFDVG